MNISMISVCMCQCKKWVGHKSWILCWLVTVILKFMSLEVRFLGLCALMTTCLISNPQNVIINLNNTDNWWHVFVHSFPGSGSHDEGIHIPKARGIYSNLAKSLPVNVPAFLPLNKRDGDEREDERVSTFLVLYLFISVLLMHLSQNALWLCGYCYIITLHSFVYLAIFRYMPIVVSLYFPLIE